MAKRFFISIILRDSEELPEESKINNIIRDVLRKEKFLEHAAIHIYARPTDTHPMQKQGQEGQVSLLDIQAKIFRVLNRSTNWNTQELKIRLATLFLKLAEKQIQTLKTGEKSL